MFKLINGNLRMENCDLEHVRGLIEEEGYSPKEALQAELELVGVDIKDVHQIELSCSQMHNKEYVDVYSKIVCDFWNSK